MLHKFLTCLHSDFFGTLRTSILSQDPLPSLDKHFQFVVQDERVRIAKGVIKEKHIKVLGFSVRLDKSHMSCIHCKKNGHKARSCFELIGIQNGRKWEKRPKEEIAKANMVFMVNDLVLTQLLPGITTPTSLLIMSSLYFFSQLENRSISQVS